MTQKNIKKIFISYSWKVQSRVVELAERLISDGIDVVIDVYHLNEGQDKFHFMERAVNDTNINKVLIICDKTYAEKADKRDGGVGDETAIISPEIYGKVDQDKFIPIVLELNEEGEPYLPTYIKSRIYIDLSTEDEKYEREYEKLVRNIYEKPYFKKPALGNKPFWLENEKVILSPIRNIIKQLKLIKDQEDPMAKSLFRNANEEFISAIKQYGSPKNSSDFEGMIKQIEELKEIRDLFVEYFELIISKGFYVGKIAGTFFENLYNNLLDATAQSEIYDINYEAYRFLLWELFVDMTAICLYYEEYAELRKILEKTYFLRTSQFSQNLDPADFTLFRSYCRILEEGYKKTLEVDKPLSVMAELLVNREMKPCLTKESLSNADIVLYQLSNLIRSDNVSSYGMWFPTAYIYHKEKQHIWEKLKSKAYCEEIMPLLGVEKIDELKEILSNSTKDVEKVGYLNSFFSAPVILDSIKVDEIASLR